MTFNAMEDRGTVGYCGGRQDGVRIFTKVLYDTDGYRKWKMLDKSWTK